MPTSTAVRPTVSRRTVLITGALGTSALAGCLDRLGTTGDELAEMAGEWPTYRFDSRNSGYNPDSGGVRDVETDWTRDIRGTPSLADGEMYINGSRRDPKTGTTRSSISQSVSVDGQLIVTKDYVFGTSLWELFCLTADSSSSMLAATCTRRWKSVNRTSDFG